MVVRDSDIKNECGNQSDSTTTDILSISQNRILSDENVYKISEKAENICAVVP